MGEVRRMSTERLVVDVEGWEVSRICRAAVKISD